jgi:AraC-like DNA-binding protein
LTFNNTRKANLFQGLLLLSISLVIFEEWLNNTGLILKVLGLTNFSESLNFVILPLFYLYIRSSLNPDEKGKKWIHFLPAIFWTLYMVFPFIQPDEYKYNSYVETKHPEWGYLDVITTVSDDPLGLRDYVNQFTVVQFLAYMGASIFILLKKFKSLKQSLFSTENDLLIILRNTTIHFLLIIILFIVTKLYFGIKSDVGGYMVASYVSFMIYITSYRVMNRSDFFNSQSSFFAFPLQKYQKSSLSEEDKVLILAKIRTEMEKNLYFTNNLASLAGLSKQISESSHHVSQVINEKLNRNFFDLLASYRIEFAKKLINDDKEVKLTIEELAEQVGYNSKSSFNIAFKKNTSKTPSEYRKSLTSI